MHRSCWAFASASSAMTDLCINDTTPTKSYTMKNPNSRYEICINQIQSCNQWKRGCNGGWAFAAAHSMSQMLSNEDDSPYVCGGNCLSWPWGTNCADHSPYPNWKWINYYQINGEAAMKAKI